MTLSPGAELESLLVRQTSFSVILLGCIDKLVGKGLLSIQDLLDVRQYALDLAVDLQNAGDASTRASGIRIAEEIEAIMSLTLRGTERPIP